MQKDGLDWHFADECRPAKCGVYQVTKSKTSIPLAATPRLAHLFDRSSPEPFFKGSKVAELEETGSNLSPPAHWSTQSASSFPPRDAPGKQWP